MEDTNKIFGSRQEALASGVYGAKCYGICKKHGRTLMTASKGNCVKCAQEREISPEQRAIQNARRFTRNNPKDLKGWSKKSALLRGMTINSDELYARLEGGWELEGILKGLPFRFDGPQRDLFQPSYDHIIPKSKEGTEDPNNLRLVPNGINMLKNDHSDEALHEFLDYIGSVYASPYRQHSYPCPPGWFI